MKQFLMFLLWRGTSLSSTRESTPGLLVKERCFFVNWLTSFRKSDFQMAQLLAIKLEKFMHTLQPWEYYHCYFSIDHANETSSCFIAKTEHQGSICGSRSRAACFELKAGKFHVVYASPEAMVSLDHWIIGGECHQQTSTREGWLVLLSMKHTAFCNGK